MKLDYLFFHHFGGFANDPLASSIGLTEEHIENAHKQRWPDFPSELNGSFIGYHIVIYPNYWKQYRLLGEETAAVRGYNTRGAMVCVAGNFNRLGNSTRDQMTPYQKEWLGKIGYAIINKNPESLGIKVKPGTEIAIPIQNVKPHRYAYATDCYGMGLSDSFGREQVVPYVQLKLYQELLLKYTSLLESLRKVKRLGSISAKSCWDENNNRG